MSWIRKALTVIYIFFSVVDTHNLSMASKSSPSSVIRATPAAPVNQYLFYRISGHPQIHRFLTWLAPSAPRWISSPGLDDQPGDKNMAVHVLVPAVEVRHELLPLYQNNGLLEGADHVVQ